VCLCAWLLWRGDGRAMWARVSRGRASCQAGFSSMCGAEGAVGAVGTAGTVGVVGAVGTADAVGAASAADAAVSAGACAVGTRGTAGAEAMGCVWDVGGEAVLAAVAVVTTRAYICRRLRWQWQQWHWQRLAIAVCQVLSFALSVSKEASQEAIARTPAGSTNAMPCSTTSQLPAAPPLAPVNAACTAAARARAAAASEGKRQRSLSRVSESS
jgi:hypothetical protein